MINSEQNGSKNIVKGLNMKVLKNTDDEAKSLNFNVQYVYIQLCFYHCICQKKKTTKNGCGFVVDGGGDAGEC